MLKTSPPIANPVWLAPMAGISDLPYRRIMKEFGAGLVFTEMISANGLIRDGKRTMELLRSIKEERPLAVQLFGDDPEVVAQATILASPYADIIDLNMGCPVKKVVRSGAGSALLRTPDTVAKMLAAVRRATSLPVTIKIRSGWDCDKVNFLQIGRIAETEGIDAITLHPRTRSQGFGGNAAWDQIAELKQALKIPVIGSGDIFTAQDALLMLEQTHCDAIMIGRGGYGNPWLIRDILALLEGGPLPPAPNAHDRYAVACRHLNYALEVFGPRKTASDMRKHLCWYSRGLPGAAGFRSQVNRCQTTAGLQLALELFLTEAVPECGATLER